MDLFEHLRRQLELIRLSCQSYDQGYTDEAIRIAQQIRVLAHQTSKSTSLLTQLGANHIRLLSTVQPISQTAVFFDGMTHMFSSGNEAGVSLAVGAALGSGSFQKPFPVDVWWNQLLYVRGDIRIRRKDLVLTAATRMAGRTLTKS